MQISYPYKTLSMTTKEMKKMNKKHIHDLQMNTSMHMPAAQYVNLFCFSPIASSSLSLSV